MHLANAILFSGVGGKVFAEITAHGLKSFFYGAIGHIFDQPAAMAAHIGNACVVAEGFSDIESALVIDREGDGVGEHGFGGKQSDLHVVGLLDTPNDAFTFVRSFRHWRGIA